MDDEIPELDVDELVEEPPEPRASLPGVQVRRTGTRPRRVLAVSGCKGGAGKSVMASNLGIYLASLGRSVVVVDADAAGAHLHSFLGVAPNIPGRDVALPEPSTLPRVQETPIPGLYFVDGGVSDGSAGLTRARTHRQLFEAVDAIDADYVVLDLGAGIEPALLDAFLGADLALYVAVPEPAGVESTYRFVRAAFLRRLRQAPDDEQTRSQLQAVAEELGGLPAPRDLVDVLVERRHGLAATASQLLDDFEVLTIVNQTRVRADLELGESMRSAAQQRLGTGIHYLGYVDFDDTLWNCVRERRPLLVHSPSTKSSKSIEKIARRLLALDAGKAPHRQARTVPSGTHHDLLEVDRGATDEDVRRAYRRAKEIYAEGALCCYGLLTPEELSRLRARLEEAFDVLLDPARRRPYELSIFPDATDPDQEGEDPLRADGDRPPAPDITPDSEFDGSLIRAVRESQGMELRHISRRTKIGLQYLQAIEDDDFGALPATVYVRGFVTEVAKCLQLDPVQVSHSYVRRLQRSTGSERP